jgi:hypothetical protein
MKESKMESATIRKSWPHEEVGELFYTDILAPVDRIEALARAVRSWSLAHEESGPIPMKDMNAVFVLADYIGKECALVRSLEQRVLNGSQTVSRPPIDLTPGAPIATTAPS